MATASQKMTLIRFFERIRGARTAAPSSDEPVMKMPHAAPSTDRPMARPAPMKAHAYGSIDPITTDQSVYGMAAAVRRRLRSGGGNGERESGAREGLRAARRASRGS